MSLQCGLVGLPNVGKSTVFNALTSSSQAESANYPFCTIDPNVGRVPVPDNRLDFLNNIINPKKMTSASVEFVDIAGLVKGASKGEGLGNQFLGHIQSVDAILHIVRCFEDKDVTHVSGEVDLIRDVEVIELELILADLEKCSKQIENLKKKSRSGDKDAISLKDALEKAFLVLQDGKPLSSCLLTEQEQSIIKPLSFLSSKPIIFIANIHENEIQNPEKNPHFLDLQKLANERNIEVLPLSGKIESELSLLSNEEQKVFLEDLGLSESSLNILIRKAYEILGYISFFTAGEQEVRAWEICKNTMAPKAASKIHSDIERGFIRAEVIPFQVFEELQSLKKVQEMGKMQVEGKDYLVQDGDIIHFRFNV